MNWFKELREKIRQYRGWVKSGYIKNNLMFIPSVTFAKYPPKSTFHGKRVLNVGCGGSTYAAPNVVNSDLHPGKGVNVVCDLSKPLPFKDEEFDLIIANHILEHVPGWWECFKELCRVVKLGGTIEIWIPPISSDGAFAYRDHINLIGLLSFMGTKGYTSPGTNLDASLELKEDNFLQTVELVRCEKRPALKWWIWFAPNKVLNWMSIYLRNTVSEEGYFFVKTGK